MKSENLNYECVMLKDGKTVENFNFHGDNAELAEDHVNHHFKYRGYDVAHWRKLGNINWKIIKAQK